MGARGRTGLDVLPAVLGGGLDEDWPILAEGTLETGLEEEE